MVGLTGGSGFLGAAIAQAAPSDVSVVTFGRSGADRNWSFANENAPDMSELDALIHCAWDTSARDRETAGLNVRGSNQLILRARDAGIPFIFISSMSSQSHTKSTYGSSKYAVETAVQGLASSRVLRPGVIRDAEGRAGLLTATLDKVAKLPITVRVSPDPQVPVTNLNRVAQEVWQSLDPTYPSGPVEIVDEWISLSSLVQSRRDVAPRGTLIVPRALISISVNVAGRLPSRGLRNLADSWRGLEDLSR